MKAWLSVAVFLIAITLSAVALLRVTAADRIGVKPSLVWAACLAVAWTAWYILQ